MRLQIFAQLLFILQLLVYSVIISSVIKYIAPNWSLLTNNLTIDDINAISLYAITIPVAMFAFVLWLNREV